MKPWERSYKVKPSKENSGPWEKEYSTMGEARQAHERSLQETEKSQTEAMREYMPDPVAMGAGAAQGMTFELADEIASVFGVDKEKAREFFKRKAEESPASYYGAELLAPSPLSMLSKVSKIVPKGGMKRAMTEGAGYAYGASEEESLEDQATDVVIGTAVGGTVGLAGKGLKALFGEPTKKELMALGTSKQTLKELRNRGLNDIKTVSNRVNNLSNKGFFKGKTAQFDPETNKFIKKKGIENVGNPTLEEIRRRKNQAIEAASKKVKSILDKKSPPKPERMTGIEDYQVIDPEKGIVLKEDIMNFGKNGEHRIPEMIERLQESHVDEVAKIEKEINKSLDRMDGSTLADLQKEKQRLYKSLEGEYGKQKSDAVKETRKELARLYKDMVNEMSGDRRIVDLNETMEELYTFSDDIDSFFADKTFQGSSAGKYAPYGQVPYYVSKVMDEMGQPTRIGRAKIGRAVEKLPEGIQQAVSDTSRSAIPKMFAGEIIKPEREEYVTKEPQGAMDSGNLQSQNLPMELVRTPLPRNSSEWIESKDFVYAKIAQHIPALLEPIQQLVENHPEDLPDFIAGLSQSQPEIFVKDKYNRVDGKIVDPVSREIATKDIMGDDDLDSYDKAIIIQELNKTGVLNYE